MSQSEENLDEVLALSLDILNLIEKKYQFMTEEEGEEVNTTNESIQFFVEQDEIDRALDESRNLKEYLLKL
mgnify:FL=1|tara:strand:+ start:1032 stop:1244 length:213 start_codon:yes stop_codon:yes gene_type:complete